MATSKTERVDVRITVINANMDEVAKALERAVSMADSLHQYDKVKVPIEIELRAAKGRVILSKRIVPNEKAAK